MHNNKDLVRITPECRVVARRDLVQVLLSNLLALTFARALFIFSSFSISFFASIYDAVAPDIILPSRTFLST
ncbi:hypothetical protein [Candidatus Ichthyocystis hellenicum]|uniref:hypothetical protein n=1 Tax=Candidatus Ichthyocystis hellenicum TaxID=1561003 RepID=UPI000B8630C8|nr:hypothetical protein [Candidatus Ichthyocystis hellenicum]